LELASSFVEDFPGGVYYVPLAAVLDANLVLPAVARSLDFLETGGRPLLESLGDYLRAKRILLFLDNFEQVLDAATVVVELLSTCSNLKILVTSREALHVRAEHEFPVLPLNLPDGRQMQTAQALLKCASVSLFVQRAQAVRPSFTFGDDNASAVAEICTRLDGLPLALELSAVLIRTFSPQEILKRLENRLSILTRGQRDLPARQRTLRDAIAWSFDLLQTDEQKLFGQLAVFVGGFSVEAAAAICESEYEGMLEKISRLVEKNLLRSQDAGDVRRFGMLETLREFAWGSLPASEADKISENHVHFFMSLADAETELKAPVKQEWLVSIEREHDNLLAALRWSIANAQVEIGLHLVCGLWRFWSVRGNLTEGREWLTKTLALVPSGPISLRSKALLGAGQLACMQNDLEAGQRLLKESLALAEEVGDKEMAGFALNSLGIAVRNQGDFASGRMLHDRSLVLFQELGHKWGTALVLNSLGVTARAEGRYGKAKELHEQSLPLFRELGDKKSVGRALMNLGMIMERDSKCDEARELLEESLSLFQDQGEKVGTTEALFLLGQLARRRGEYDQACDLLTQCLTISTELGDKETIAYSLEEFAACACTQGEALTATGLFGAAEALREAIKLPIPPAYRPDYEQCVSAARALLGVKRFSQEWARGKAMPLQQAIEHARSLQAHRQKENPR
jgi:predicted ATPase